MRFFSLFIPSLLLLSSSLRAADALPATDMAGSATGKVSFAVISDIHVMAPSLLVKDGKAFSDYIAHDRKMLKESTALMDAALDSLLRVRPQFVLVAGDLTKDGEAVSHRYVVDHYLSRLKQAGIPSFVIPGNHDVNNPHAVSFDGEKRSRVSTVTAEEFADCYADYGYGGAIARDARSLSYVCQLTDSLRLLAIDACKYEENDFEKDICVTGGRIKPETLAFVEEQMADAHRKGIRVLVMMHHGLVRHWKWQDKAMKEYLVDDWKRQAKAFRKAGVKVVFTGHFHAQDIVRKGDLYDIETGSLVSYPSPFRLVTLEGKKLQVTTRHIDRIESPVPEGASLADYARHAAEAGIVTIVSEMLPEKVPTEVARYAGEALGTAYVAHLAGDERMPADYPALLKGACKRLRPYSWKYAFVLKRLGNYFFTDLAPQDNELTIMTNL